MTQLENKSEVDNNQLDTNLNGIPVQAVNLQETSNALDSAFESALDRDIQGRAAKAAINTADRYISRIDKILEEQVKFNISTETTTLLRTNITKLRSEMNTRFTALVGRNILNSYSWALMYEWILSPASRTEFDYMNKAVTKFKTFERDWNLKTTLSTLEQKIQDEYRKVAEAEWREEAEAEWRKKEKRKPEQRRPRNNQNKQAPTITAPTITAPETSEPDWGWVQGGHVNIGQVEAPTTTAPETSESVEESTQGKTVNIEQVETPTTPTTPETSESKEESTQDLINQLRDLLQSELNYSWQIKVGNDYYINNKMSFKQEWPYLLTIHVEGKESNGNKINYDLKYDTNTSKLYRDNKKWADTLVDSKDHISVLNSIKARAEAIMAKIDEDDRKRAVEATWWSQKW